MEQTNKHSCSERKHYTDTQARHDSEYISIPYDSKLCSTILIEKNVKSMMEEVLR